MAPIPKTMFGVEIPAPGGPEALQWRTDLPVPAPADGEVLVRNEFIGVNYLDAYFRAGTYPAVMPLVAGGEGAGTVVASRSPRFREGDRVAYMADHAYAELTAVPAARAALLPPGLAADVVAAALVQGLTALTLVREAAQMRPVLGIAPPFSDVVEGGYGHNQIILGNDNNDNNSGVAAAAAATPGSAALVIARSTTPRSNLASGGQPGPLGLVLVHAAAGGTGSHLVRMCAALGCKVIGTAGGPSKCEMARRGGAMWVVDSLGEDVVARVREITHGRGVDVIFDGVGKDTFEADLEMIARKGSLVLFGSSSGPIPPLDSRRLGDKNIRLVRPTVFGYLTTAEEWEDYTQELLDMLLAGKAAVHIHQVYPLREVARAHADLEGRKTMGKLLLSITQ